MALFRVTLLAAAILRCHKSFRKRYQNCSYRQTMIYGQLMLDYYSDVHFQMENIEEVPIHTQGIEKVCPREIA